MKKERFPLSWPDGRPRSKFARESQFGRHSMSVVMHELENEVRRIGGSGLVVSTNVRLRIDGLPYSGQAQPHDTGAAAYFMLKGRAVAFSCDRWSRVECNIYAIARTIEATRGIERWGAATQEQTFRGFAALPERASGPDPYELLGLRAGCSEEELSAAYRRAAKVHHPDVPETGSYAKWQQIQDAYNLISQNVRGAS